MWENWEILRKVRKFKKSKKSEKNEKFEKTEKFREKWENSENFWEKWEKKFEQFSQVHSVFKWATPRLYLLGVLDEIALLTVVTAGDDFKVVLGIALSSKYWNYVKKFLTISTVNLILCDIFLPNRNSGKCQQMKRQK